MMKLSRRLTLVAAAACTGLALIPAGPAFARGGDGGSGGGSGGGGGGTSPSQLTVFDTCGGTLTMKEGSPDALTVGITEPASRNESWSLQAFEQDYNVTTGGRTRFPISMVPSPFRSFQYESRDKGFSTSATIVDTPDATHGFSYTATRTSPSPLTCSGQGFWTDHGDTIVPDPLNPTAKPDTAPALTGVNAAKAGTNTVSVGFDQEMLATTPGLPTNDSFAVTVDGVSREVIEVNVVNDSPPDKAAVSLVLAGDPLPVGANVTVQYQQPSSTSVSTTVRQLQDLDGLATPSFGPVSFLVD